jgi:sporulation protein YlmC with PRC-barrel domain
MVEFLVDNLQDKTVMNAAGQELGALKEITLRDQATGDLQHLVIERNPDINPNLASEYQSDKFGNLLVPTDNVTSVEDYILIT